MSELFIEYCADDAKSNLFFQDLEGNVTILGEIDNDAPGFELLKAALAAETEHQRTLAHYAAIAQEAAQAFNYPDGGNSFPPFERVETHKYKPGDRVVAVTEHEHNKKCGRIQVSEYVKVGQFGTVHSNRVASAAIWVTWDGYDGRCFVWPCDIAPAPRYKPGDRVVAATHNAFVAVGVVGTIKGIDGGPYYFVAWPGYDHWLRVSIDEIAPAPEDDGAETVATNDD